MPLMLDLSCLPFFKYGQDKLPPKWLLYCFCAIPINPGFISCYNPWEEDLFVSDFIKQFLAHKHMLWLLYVHEQPTTNSAHSGPPSEFGATLNRRHLSSQQSPKICLHWPKCFQLSTEVPLHFNQEIHSEVCPLHSTVTEGCFNISYISSTVFLRLKYT